MKTVNLNDNTIIKLQFVGDVSSVYWTFQWDIAGQERFGTMTSHYYRDALGKLQLFAVKFTTAGALIVFDLTDKASFEAVEKWRDDIDRKMRPDPDVPVLLLGNKVDLVKQNRDLMQVTEEQMDAICTRFENFIGWYATTQPPLGLVIHTCRQLTSACEDENIAESIKILLDKIMERNNLEDDSNTQNVIRPAEVTSTGDQGGCCGMN